MPNRILKESICTSETIDELSAFEETFFYRLIVSCDDYGIMDARPAILKSRLFPLKEIRLQQIEDALRKLTSAELVSTYEVDGKPFLLMNTWDRHQQIRAARGKYPGPDGKIPSNGIRPKPSDIIRYHMISSDSICSRNPIQSESNPKEDVVVVERAREETPFGPVEVDPLIVKVQTELNGLTDTHYNALNDYRDSLGDELVSFAIDSAVGNGSRNWSYVEAILRSYEQKHIKTIGEAKAEHEKHKQQPKQQPKLLRSQDYKQREYKESEMQKVLGVSDIYNDDAR